MVGPNSYTTHTCAPFPSFVPPITIKPGESCRWYSAHHTPLLYTASQHEWQCFLSTRSRSKMQYRRIAPRPRARPSPPPLFHANVSCIMRDTPCTLCCKAQCRISFFWVSPRSNTFAMPRLSKVSRSAHLVCRSVTTTQRYEPPSSLPSQMNIFHEGKCMYIMNSRRTPYIVATYCQG